MKKGRCKIFTSIMKNGRCQIFLSVMKKGQRLWPYLAVAALCVIVDNIYALYGHGVRSSAMDFMFLYPLLGGFIIKFLSLHVHGDDSQGWKRIGVNLYNSGIAALTCGSLLRGIVEIAGTDSVYINYFFVAGGIMVFCGIVGILRE
jgi:hypothetical protein